MLSRFQRTELLLGCEGMERLKKAHVAVFGVGGVGGYVVEALVRSGVGTIDVFDSDTVCITNLNRQIIAVEDTIGQYKVDAIKSRALSINPEVVINTYKCFYLPENADEYDLSVYDYIVDAIDTVKAKIELVLRAQAASVPIISCMGAGNKMEASMFEVSDIYKTEMCPLAKTMRQELKKRRVKRLKVVYSKEKPIKPMQPNETDGGIKKRSTPGSIAFVPAVAGLIAAGEVVKELVKS